MKKLLKNVIICIAMIYLILGISYTIYNKIQVNKEISALNISNNIDEGSHEVTVSLGKNIKDVSELINISKLVLKDVILMDYISILIISIIFGTVLGILASIKYKGKQRMERK